MTRPHLPPPPRINELVDLGEGAPVFMATPLRVVPIVSFSPIQFHVPAPVERAAA